MPVQKRKCFLLAKIFFVLRSKEDGGFSLFSQKLCEDVENASRISIFRDKVIMTSILRVLAIEEP